METINNSNAISNANEPTKLWNASFITLLMIGMLSQSASQMMNPILPSYLIYKGAALTLTAFITSGFALIAMITRPFSGAVNDLFNPKKLMILSGFLIGLCILGYAFSPTIPLLMFFRVLHGIAFSIQGTTNIAFSTSFIPRNRMGEGMGYMAMSIIVPTAIGPNLGIWISDSISFRLCLIIAAILTFVAAMCVFLVPYTYEKRPQKENVKFKISFNNLLAKELLFLTLCISIFSMGNGLVTTYIKLLADDRGIANVGLFFTISSFVMIFIRPFSGRLLDKKGLSFILIPSYFIASLSSVFIAVATSTWMLLIAGALRAVGQGAGMPSIQATAVKSLEKERRGVAVSTCFIGQDLGQFVGPIIGSYIVTQYNYEALFNSYAVMLILIALFYIFYRKFSKNEVAQRAMSVER